MNNIKLCTWFIEQCVHVSRQDVTSPARKIVFKLKQLYISFSVQFKTMRLETQIFCLLVQLTD